MRVNGVPPLQRGVRDLAATARLMVPVLEAFEKAQGAEKVEVIATKLGVESEDVGRACVALELLGYVETTHFKITAAGTAAYRETA